MKPLKVVPENVNVDIPFVMTLENLTKLTVDIATDNLPASEESPYYCRVEIVDTAKNEIIYSITAEPFSDVDFFEKINNNKNRITYIRLDIYEDYYEIIYNTIKNIFPVEIFTEENIICRVTYQPIFPLRANRCRAAYARRNTRLARF